MVNQLFEEDQESQELKEPPKMINHSNDSSKVNKWQLHKL